MDQRPVCMLLVRNYRRGIGHIQKTTHGGKEGLHFPFSKIDGNVKHIFREHSQEADHWANLGAEAQRKN